MAGEQIKVRRGREWRVVREVLLPAVLTRAEVAEVFGRSVTWLDAYLLAEGSPLLAGSRLINGRRVYKTATVLQFLEDLPTCAPEEATSERAGEVVP